MALHFKVYPAIERRLMLLTAQCSVLFVTKVRSQFHGTAQMLVFPRLYKKRVGMADCKQSESTSMCCQLLTEQERYSLQHTCTTVGLYTTRIYRIIRDGYSSCLVRLRLKTLRKSTRDFREIGGSPAVLYALSKGPHYRHNHHTHNTPRCVQFAFPHRFQNIVIGL